MGPDPGDRALLELAAADRVVINTQLQLAI